MSGQTQKRRIFVRIAGFFTVFALALVFSGCPDPITALEDTVLEPPGGDTSPEDSGTSPETPVTPPAQSASVKVNDSAALKAALENPKVMLIEVGAGLSLTVDPSVTVAGSDKSLIVPAGSMVTVRGLSVPAGAGLSIYKGEGNSTGQVVLDSLNIGGDLSVFGDIYITLDRNHTVAGNLNLYGATVLIRGGGRIEGSDGGGTLSLKGTVYVNEEDNNFYDKLGAKVKPPAGSFSWNTANRRWEESREAYPAALADFLVGQTPGKYVVRPDDAWPADTVVAAAPAGLKTLVLVGDSARGNLSSLTLAQGARLKLTGLGTLESGSVSLLGDAEFETDVGINVKALAGGGLGDRAKFVVRGNFYNPAMPNWTMGYDARFEFYAGGRVYTSADDTALYIGAAGDRNSAIISLDSGRIVLSSRQFKLEGGGWLNNGKVFSQPWPGGISINGNLEVEGTFTVEPFSRLPYFELTGNAVVTVKSGGSLSVRGRAVTGIISYARLGEGSTIVVEDGGKFYNEIFPNWEHGGSGDREGAFVFKPGSSVYASPDAFGYPGTGWLLYIGNGSAAPAPVVKLSQGRIRLSGKTFALEADGTPGKASLGNDLFLSEAKLVLKNSELSIGSGKKFTLDNKSGEQFVSLKTSQIFVESGGEFEITGPASPGGKKLAALDSSSTLEVKSGGVFLNGIYDNWDIKDSGSRFIINAGSGIHIPVSGRFQQLIGNGKGSWPISLSGGTLVYTREKITLGAMAEVSGLAALPVWPGLDLDISGSLTVNVDSTNNFSLDGLNVTVGGSAGFTLQGTGTLTMKNSTVTVKGMGTFTNSLYYDDSSGRHLNVSYQGTAGAFIVEAGGKAFLGDGLCEISDSSVAMIYLKSGIIRFDKYSLSVRDSPPGGREAHITGANIPTIQILLGVQIDGAGFQIN